MGHHRPVRDTSAVLLPGKPSRPRSYVTRVWGDTPDCPGVLDGSPGRFGARGARTVWTSLWVGLSGTAPEPLASVTDNPHPPGAGYPISTPGVPSTTGSGLC